MKYNELDIDSNKKGRRVGRGIAAGRGKTAGRGTKGQGSRTGSGRRPGFEGGQNPLMQRLPKLPGFRSIHPKAELVTTEQLNNMGAVVDNFTLTEAGVTSSPHVKVKLVAKGEVTKKVTVKIQGASKSAIELLTAAGGSFVETPQVGRVAIEKEEIVTAK